LRSTAAPARRRPPRPRHLRARRAGAPAAPRGRRGRRGRAGHARPLHGRRPRLRRRRPHPPRPLRPTAAPLMNRWALVGAFSLALLAVSGSADSAAAPAVAAQAPRILYSSDWSGTSEIYAV